MAFVNNREVAHQGSGAQSSVFPDVCLTPTGSSVVPIPYQNVGRSEDVVDGTSTVTIDGKMVMVQGAKYAKSSGDGPGVVGGITSGTNQGECELMNYSFNVKVEGKGLGRLADRLFHNKKNTHG